MTALFMRLAATEARLYGHRDYQALWPTDATGRTRAFSKKLESVERDAGNASPSAACRQPEDRGQRLRSLGSTSTTARIAVSRQNDIDRQI